MELNLALKVRGLVALPILLNEEDGQGNQSGKDTYKIHQVAHVFNPTTQRQKQEDVRVQSQAGL